MNLPQLNVDGYLPPGIYLTNLDEVLDRFGQASKERQDQSRLLRLIVERARKYPTIKRILIWGSFVSAKPAPNDLDYSIVVDVRHRLTVIAQEDRRFFVPSDANLYYGTDRGYLIIEDYPPEPYAETIIFLTRTRQRQQCGIVEIYCHGDQNQR